MSKYSISIHWDSKNEEYIATTKEFPYLSGIADFQEEAVEILEEAIALGIEMLKEDGCEIPEPIAVPEYSGNIRLRLPKSLHKQLADMAELEGISLNQYMVSLLSMNAGRLDVHLHAHQHDHKHETTVVLADNTSGSEMQTMTFNPDRIKTPVNRMADALSN